MKKLIQSFFALINSTILIFILFSCVSNPKTENTKIEEKTVEPKISTITLTFTGDIMAHTNVTRMKDFSLIYKDILDITQNDDVTFANFETPVVDDQEYENWPNFNAKNAYALAAMDAGFDAFTLSNNHTNDQGLKGIWATRDFFASQKENGIYSVGLKYEENGDYTYQIIEKNGFTILFMGVTEIYNSSRYIEWFDTTDRSEATRAKFIERVKKMREEHPCDLFVLAFHCNEPEYVIPVTDKRKAYYHQLVDAGVDVVWANHPHVMQEWEVIKSKENPNEQKVIMYSVGNLISGQRSKRNYENPAASREYTGESILMQLKFKKTVTKSKDEAKTDDITISAEKPKVVILTNHTEGPVGKYDSLIKKLDENFIESLPSELDKTYYKKRLELCNEITGKTIWK